MKAIELTVELGVRSYPILIGTGLLADAATWARYASGRPVAVVTNETVAPLYLERLTDGLRACARSVLPVVLPDGEAYKTGATLNQVYDALLAAQCDRDTLVVALGGGVIGDLAGFAAATYQRGVDFVQVPTTLLSQVDSSVGGKTGINHPRGKNMVGAFYQPRLVLADVDTLQTLPPRELSAGLAEVIKHGAVADATYFETVERMLPALLGRDPAALADIIAGSCRIKAEVVAADEREGGRRAILNFGHTFGHAIEAALGYGTWLHGEAVGAGMVLAARLSSRIGPFEPGAVERIESAVRAAGLPVAPPALPLARWHELMALDKKAKEGLTRFVLLRTLGEAYVSPVDLMPLEAVLREASA